MLPVPHSFVAFDLELGSGASCGGSRVLCAASAAPRVPFVAAAAEAPPIDVCVWRSARGGTAAMTSAEVCAFVDALWAAFTAGHTIITWGGTSADWRVLASECRTLSPCHADKCRFMALYHVDIALAAAATLGSMMGLRAACLGMGLDAKHADASAHAPRWWARGDTHRVLAHVAHDARVTAGIYARMFEEARTHDLHMPRLTWRTTRNYLAQWHAPWITLSNGSARILNVSECLALPKPHTPFKAPACMDCRTAAAWIHVP